MEWRQAQFDTALDVTLENPKRCRAELATALQILRARTH